MCAEVLCYASDLSLGDGVFARDDGRFFAAEEGGGDAGMLDWGEGWWFGHGGGGGMGRDGGAWLGQVPRSSQDELQWKAL